MKIQHLSLTNFRNFARLDVNVPEGTTLIVGDNAQGKTSILEAIYFLVSFSSYHADSDRQLINFIESRQKLAVGRIKAEYTRRGRTHRMEVRIIKEEDRNGVERGRKEVLIDGVKKKLVEAVGHFNAVLFLPQMLRVIDGSPGERRRYVDLALAQVNQHYAQQISDYNKVLSQRNALLKQLQEREGSSDQLDFWDERLAKHGAQIIHGRIEAIQEIESIAARLHHELTRNHEVLRLAYQPAYDPFPSPNKQPALLDAPVDRSNITTARIEEGFRKTLEAIRQEEIYRGVTTIGPHRDEVRFMSNGMDLGTYGSRGQVRTTMLTMKMAEVEWIQQKTGEMPVLLLDEVLAELDERRRKDLLSRVQGWEQTLMTTTDTGLFGEDFVNASRVWHIKGGRLEE